MKIPRYPKYCDDCKIFLSIAATKDKILNTTARRYNISVEQYKNLLAESNDKCQLCGKEKAKNRALNIDHCHLTGNIRGVLCSGCNTSLSAIENAMDNNLFFKFLDYLEYNYQLALDKVKNNVH